jgi:dihydroorotase-like cyclic amidohydrolase
MRKSSHDIYQDLDDRIKERQRSIEDLCRAETSTYNKSGSTSFLTIEVPKKSSSMTSFNFSLESPEVPIQSPQVPPEPCRRKLRPSPIQIKSVSKPDIHKDYNYFLANCPESWETQGVQKVLESLKPSHSVHFTGISSAAGINTLRHFKKTFKSLTCDISISHLCFTSASIGIGDTRFKSAPPIRNQGNCNLLWDLLKMKGIDCICSAHSFILPALKLTENFQQSLSGIPAAGLSLFAVWNMLNVPVSTQEQLEHYIVRLAKWLSLHPARVLRLSHERGRIEKGLRADLVVWNPFQKYCFQQDWRYQATSPFKMQEMMGRVLRVYLKGEVVFDGEKGCEAVGEIIKRV